MVCHPRCLALCEPDEATRTLEATSLCSLIGTFALGPSELEPVLERFDVIKHGPGGEALRGDATALMMFGCLASTWGEWDVLSADTPNSTSRLSDEEVAKGSRLALQVVEAASLDCI